MHVTHLGGQNQRKGGKIRQGVFLMVVVFSACHLRVLFQFNLRCLGDHSEISPVPLRGFLKSIFTHGYRVFN